MADALIVTLLLDPDSQARFEQLRQAWFPPARNWVPAHISLFHALPGEEEAAVAGTLAARAPARFAVSVTGLRSLGRGVAYRLESPALLALRAALAAAFAPWLTAQDRQRYAPHVTVQNKATPADARACLAALSAGFSPWSARAEALLLWRYLGGPWALAARIDAVEGSPETHHLA